MGKKGTGRKAFLKGARPQEVEEELPTSNQLPTNPVEVVKVAEDPSERFIKTDSSAASPAAETAASAPAAAAASSPSPSSVVQTTDGKAVEEESRGQLVQRHKRVQPCTGRSVSCSSRPFVGLGGRLKCFSCAGAESPQGACQEAWEEEEGRSPLYLSLIVPRDEGSSQPAMRLLCNLTMLAG